MRTNSEKQQLIWYGHIMRMEDCDIARHVAEWNPWGKKWCGRPVNTWKDGIRERMQIRRNIHGKSILCLE
jgi:hypothetical protein